jgi:hypothetical protein
LQLKKEAVSKVYFIATNAQTCPDKIGEHQISLNAKAVIQYFVVFSVLVI